MAEYFLKRRAKRIQMFWFILLFNCVAVCGLKTALRIDGRANQSDGCAKVLDLPKNYQIGSNRRPDAVQPAATVEGAT
jgi:hypothetical protein